MKLVPIFFLWHFVLAHWPLLAESDASCEIPYSRSSRVGWYEPTAPALPTILTEVTQTGTAVSTIAGILAGLDVTLLSQGTRAYTTLEIASCNDAALPDSGSLSWMDSPTQLSVGHDLLQYHVGAVVGNWILLTGITAGWSIVATQLGMARARIPGGLILPILFLMGPTSSSAVTLLRDGTAVQKVLGGCSITAQSMGLNMLSVFLSPAFFGAQWVRDGQEYAWADASEPNYVKHYGLLFSDYRGGRQFFVNAELLMSLATGVLKSYQATQTNCKDIVTAAAAVSLAYLASLIVLRPHAEFKDRLFFTSIAALESTALTMQAISLWTGTEESQSTTRTISESIVMVAEWTLTIRTLYDVGRRIYGFYQRSRAVPVKKLALSRPTTPLKSMILSIWLKSRLSVSIHKMI
ncbi:MAG: hypothetical protein I8H75_05805 [Myxococcaceae bacterium]|nr:hypothetical protein [Myxococcaceae bacterium]